MTDDNRCLIWGENHKAAVNPNHLKRESYVNDSARAGGGYNIDNYAIERVKRLSPIQKARLTTWLIEQRSHGNTYPWVTVDIINYTNSKRPLPVHERADRLLRYIRDHTGPEGTPYKLGDVRGLRDPIDAALAWSESTSMDEVNYLMKYLDEKRWVEAAPFAGGAYHSVIMTVDGYARIEEQLVNVDLAQAFVAMWFDDKMTDAYEKGIEPAIREAGYTPLKESTKKNISIRSTMKS